MGFTWTSTKTLPARNKMNITKLPAIVYLKSLPYLQTKKVSW